MADVYMTRAAYLLICILWLIPAAMGLIKLFREIVMGLFGRYLSR